MKDNTQIVKLYLHLYTNYYKELLRMYMKTHRSTDEAHDAVCSFLLIFCEKMTDGRDSAGKETEAYLKGSFNNFILDLFRKKKPYYYSEFKSNNDEDATISKNVRFDITDTDKSDKLICSVNEKSIIKSCFEKMNPQDVIYIKLRFVDEFGNKEIGRQLNKNAKYVALRVSRAKKAFRKAYFKLGFKAGDF